MTDSAPAFIMHGARDAIRDTEFRASDVLFRLEPEGYRIYLAEYRIEAVEAGPPKALGFAP